ncbi:MAG: undecaprenyl-phosphate alpha-N-acetylglucosaminyl 1-phosphate transferase [Chloroflexi bacterium]|nr:MAG: undecaprenyl-phosphate alpha-N-acetylglucosaminyl 1-phosphate transferase [Chloroflexota bacterium]
MTYFLIFSVTFVLALLFVPGAKRLSVRFGVVAKPGGRRKHVGRIPMLGGLAIFGAWLVGILLMLWLMPPTEADDAIRIWGVILGSIVIVIGGLIDDWRELSPRGQFVIQFVAAALAMWNLVFIEVFTNPFPGTAVWEMPPFSWVFTVQGDLIWIWRPLALLFTLFWVVGMINAINWLDGLDGLAAGVCTIAALLFAWHSFSLGQTTVPLLPLALAGALLGFLPFNFAPAKIFLGSVGAYLLGYQMATLSILSPAKLSTALLVLAIPIMDVAWLTINRMRRGRNPMSADRNHLHFRLADSGISTRKIVLGYYAITIVFGLVAVLVPSRLVKVSLWIVLYLGVFLFLTWLRYGLLFFIFQGKTDTRGD